MGVSAEGRLLVVLQSLAVVTLHTVSGLVDATEVEQGVDVALFGREMVQPYSLCLVASDPESVEVQVPQIALGARMTLVGGEEVPFGGLHLVDPDSLPCVAHEP